MICVFQVFPQFLKTVGEVIFNCFYGDVHLTGNLILFQLSKTAQVHHLPAFRRSSSSACFRVFQQRFVRSLCFIQVLYHVQTDKPAVFLPETFSFLIKFSDEFTIDLNK